MLQDVFFAAFFTGAFATGLRVVLFAAFFTAFFTAGLRVVFFAAFFRVRFPSGGGLATCFTARFAAL